MKVAPVGRLPDAPPDSRREAFVLWPEQLVVIEAWATRYKCKRSMAVRMIIETAGQPPANGQFPTHPKGGKTASFNVWPQQSAIIDAWVAKFECSRSDAFRAMAASATNPDAKGAQKAAQRLIVARETLHARARAARPVEKTETRRLKRQLAARLRRARQKPE